MFDKDGPTVLVECHRILRDETDKMRNTILPRAAPPTPPPPMAGRGGPAASSTTTGATAPPATTRQRQQAFPYLANFPEEEDPETVQRALLVHLDTMMGDIRQVQSVMRALGALMCNTRFADQLDTSHEHLVPFANGVLDLDALELRPGRPEDFVMRGPTYPWIDYDKEDPVVLEMERMLTTIFPDRVVRAFFLDVGGTLLRRRNRFKHFYILTAWMPFSHAVNGIHWPGNTNGGKSLLLSLMKQAFATLCGLLSILAITARESDPSGHTDYLARTHGLAMCVCHEPDCGSQLILPDRVKVMTSDSDHLSVREIYGTSRDMPITFKLFMACNTAPGFSTLDAAIMERVQYIPFNSTFGSEDETPADELRQFRLRKFIARRDLSEERQLDLSKRLMGMFFAAYVRNHMERPTYTLRPPRRIRLEARMQLQEVSIFRAWVGVFLRPCGMSLTGTLSLNAHQAATVMSRVIHTAAEQWDAQEGHRQWINTKWHRLPRCVQQDVMTPGSPGWVRCQCVYLYRFVVWQSGNSIEELQDESNTATKFFDVVCPFVDTKIVAEQFNRFRRQSRSVLNRPLTNLHNSAPHPVHPTASTLATTPSTTTADGTTPNNTHRSSMFVGLSMRMKLDTGLVRNILQEVVGTEPFGDHYLGRALLSPDGVAVENNQPSSALIDDALAFVCRRWYRRYRAPLAYPALLSRDAMQEAMRRVALRPVIATVNQNTNHSATIQDMDDDWDKMDNNGYVESDDDEFAESEATMYYPIDTGEGAQPTSGDGGVLLLGRSERSSEPSRVPGNRDRNMLRRRPCLFFPCARVPHSRLIFNPDERHHSPMQSTRPSNAHSAESLLMTEAFWNASELQKEADESRLHGFDAGFSGIGEYKALRDYGQRTRQAIAEQEQSLAFYLGSETRQTL